MIHMCSICNCQTGTYPLYDHKDDIYCEECFNSWVPNDSMQQLNRIIVWENGWFVRDGENIKSSEIGPIELRVGGFLETRSGMIIEVGAEGYVERYKGPIKAEFYVANLTYLNEHELHEGLVLNYGRTLLHEIGNHRDPTEGFDIIRPFKKEDLGIICPHCKNRV